MQTEETKSRTARRPAWMLKEARMVKCCLVRDGEPLPGVSAAAVLDSPQRVLDVLRPVFAGADREMFAVILVDARNRLLGVNICSMGTLTASLVHPREVFKPALLASAAAIIVAHNHPSNDPTPSAEDREVTRRLARAGALLGVKVLDHVVYADAGYYSFKKHQLL